MPSGVYIRTKEYREESRKAHKGQIPWNKNLRGYRCKSKKQMPKEKLKYLYIDNKLTMRKCAEYFSCDTNTIMNWLRKYEIPSRSYSESRKGRKVWNKGLNAKDDSRIASGSRQGNWSGGVYTNERHREVGKGKYAGWRREIFIRDNFTCAICRKVGGILNAHHIKSWVEYPEKRYDIDNGITLCEDCHKDVHRNEVDCLVYLGGEVSGE